MPNLELENKYSGLIVAGVDEAGRGPLAGPVVAGVVIVNPQDLIERIDDSKKIPLKKRETLYEQIITKYIWAVGIVEVSVIDDINILEATKKACMLAVNNLKVQPHIVLVDGNMKFPDPKKFISIVKGDTLSLSIAAGSIVAKVTRDRIMRNLDKEYPSYFWKDNVGYGTQKHLRAIRDYGQTIHHRKSFKITSD